MHCGIKRAPAMDGGGTVCVTWSTEGHQRAILVIFTLVVILVVLVVVVLVLRLVSGVQPLDPAPPVETPVGPAHPVLQAPPLLCPGRRVRVSIGDAVDDHARLAGVDQPLPLGEQP